MMKIVKHGSRELDHVPDTHRGQLQYEAVAGRALLSHALLWS